MSFFQQPMAVQSIPVITRIYRASGATQPLGVETKDNLRYKFYPVTGKCFKFEVKAAHDAHIALSPTPQASDYEPIVEIIIGGWNNTRSVIRKNKTTPNKAENETINILNGDEYRTFWVKWDRATINVGCNDETNPFLSWTDPQNFPINYVGICTGWGARGSWKVEVPRSYATWHDAKDGHVPDGAVVGGQECNGELVYVAKAKHGGFSIPGKLVTSHGCAYIPWRSREHRKPSYQVLVGGPNSWVATSGSNVPAGAFPGGESESGETLFIGRVQHGGSVITGKVQKSKGVCYVSFDGQELCFTEYEVLIH